VVTAVAVRAADSRARGRRRMQQALSFIMPFLAVGSRLRLVVDVRRIGRLSGLPRRP
jgi:hypothetical protein